jgi:hypothetical protein
MPSMRVQGGYKSRDGIWCVLKDVIFLTREHDLKAEMRFDLFAKARQNGAERPWPSIGARVGGEHRASH